METDLITSPADSNAQNASSMLPPATGSANINVDAAERVLSVFSGAMATVYGLRNLGSKSGLAMTLTGGFLLYRGLTGYCAINNLTGRNTVNRKASAMEVKGTMRINKPRADVYAYWRQLENLPRFMKHLESVKEEDYFRSTWKAVVPGGLGTVTWEAAITEDKPGELLRWSTLPGSTVDNAGEVSFKDAPDSNETEITACITYRLPAGDVGGLAAKLFNPVVEKMMQEDLRRFKSIMETGELPAEEPLNVETEKTSKGRKKKQSKQGDVSQDLSQTQNLSTPQSYESTMLEQDR